MAIHNKWTKLAAAAILAGGLLVPGAANAAVSFTDIDNSYAKEAILALAAEGILDGVGNNKFNPGGKMTREQFAKVLVVGGDLYDPMAILDLSPYADNQDPNAWYYNYVRVISQKGIMIGTSVTDFGVGQSMTREMAVVAIVRALGLEPATKADAVPAFADAAQISNWAKPHIALAQQLGITNGVGNNTFAPKVQTTREMASKMLYESLTNMNEITSAANFRIEYYSFNQDALNTFTVKIQTQNMDPNAKFRYVMSVTDKAGNPVAGQVFHQEVAPGEWSPNQTNEHGEMMFGPDAGYTAAELEQGLTVKFKTGFVSAGDHVITLGLVDAADQSLVAQGALDVTVETMPGWGTPELQVKEASVVIVDGL